MHIFPEKSTILLNDQSDAVPLSRGSVLGNYINNTTHRIGSPNRSTCSPDDFNAVKNGKWNVFCGPVDGTTHPLENLTTIDQGEELFSSRTTEVPHGYKIIIANPTSHIHSRDIAERVHH